ncbi:hypothetical protein KIW84_014002 [Lathyrus oleraceus]|uniref:Retrotransposon gag domain-containing protein n=1 Tax=Pisum sativum TaxID=3888 RepID=A0A9D5BLK5_PEA|nr:hypothetical protein KIW84_014002 [Pisum sativum]
MAPSRTQLQGMSQKNSEGFKEYAQRWRELAARVQPPLVDREMSDLFMGTLQGAFAERMVGCPVTNFADIVVAGERIESWLKLRKIQGGNASSSGSKKPFGNGQRKKEGDTSAVYAQRGQSRDRYFQHTAAVTIPTNNYTESYQIQIIRRSEASEVETRSRSSNSEQNSRTSEASEEEVHSISSDSEQRYIIPETLSVI